MHVSDIVCVAVSFDHVAGEAIALSLLSHTRGSFWWNCTPFVSRGASLRPLFKFLTVLCASTLASCGTCLSAVIRLSSSRN